MSNVTLIINTLVENQKVLLTRIEQLENQVETIANDLYYMRELLHDDGK